MLQPFLKKLEHRFVLSDSDIAALKRASAHVVKVRSRTDLISEGDVPDHIHLIRSGLACRYKVLEDGKRSIVAYLLPGDICDLDVPLLGRLDHSVGTLSACEVVRIPRAAISGLTENHPELEQALRWAALVDEAILRQWLSSMGRRSADQLVAHLFCELLLRFQAVGLASGNSYALPVSQADLADSTGVSNVHVNRILQALRGKKLINFREKRMTILNFEGLKAFAGFSSNYLYLSPKG